MYVKNIFYIMLIYTHTHTCYVTCMLGFAKPVRRWEKKIKTCKYFFFLFINSSFGMDKTLQNKWIGTTAVI